MPSCVPAGCVPQLVYFTLVTDVLCPTGHALFRSVPKLSFPGLVAPAPAKCTLTATALPPGLCSTSHLWQNAFSVWLLNHGCCPEPQPFIMRDVASVMLSRGTTKDGSGQDLVLKRPRPCFQLAGAHGASTCGVSVPH